MKKFAFFSDILFSFLVSAVCSIVLFRYFAIPLPLALALALVCGVLTAISITAILRLRRKNLALKKWDEAQKQKLTLHLALLSDEEKTEYFSRALSTVEEPIKRFGKLRLFNKTEFYFLKFTLEPLSADEIPNLARLKTGKKKILLCAQIDENALLLCQRLDIEVKTGEWLYTYLKANNLLPDAYLGEEVGAPKAKRHVKLWFSKKNAKRFLIGGTLILLISRLTPFYYYYLLLGGLLVCAAVFVRIFGYE